MKTKRILAVILSLMMLGSVFTGLSNIVFAAGTQVDEALQVESYVTAEGKLPWIPDWWTGFTTNRLVFDENFDTENDLSKLGITTQGDIPGYDFGEVDYVADGLTMIPSTQGLAGAWIWRNGKTAWAPLEANNTMIRFRAKMAEGGVLGFQTQVVGAEGKVYLNIYASRSVWMGQGVATITDTYKNGVGTDWMDYLVTSNGTNYSLYAKAVGAPYWNLVGTSEGFYGKTANNVVQLDSSTSGTYVKSIEVLTPRGSEKTIEEQKAEIAAGMERAKNTTVSYTEHPSYNPTIAKYAHIKAITYDGFNYKGQKTKIFAYLGFPEGASKDAKVPAVVLIHGGGGHPFLEWVRLWNERGYAAIAMETTGSFPTGPNVGVSETASGDYAYAFGDFAEEGYILAPKCGNPTTYTDIENQWNYHALTGIILGSNILRQDERVDSSKMGVTGVSWGGTLTSQIIGIDNRYAFAIPVYGTAYLKLHPFENYGNEYVQELWAAEQNLNNATMPIMWYVWNDDGAFGIPGYMASYNHTAPLNDKTILFMRDNWGHSHGSVFHENGTENHSKVFADWAINNRGGYATFTEQPQGRTFNAKFDIPEDVTGDVKATLYYITEPMTYSNHNKFGYSTQNYLDQWWEKTTAGITVDRAAGTVSGTIPNAARGYYINLEFTVDGVECESTSVYVEVPKSEIEEPETPAPDNPEPDPSPEPGEPIVDVNAFATSEGRFPWIQEWWGEFSSNRLVFDENFTTNYNLSELGVSTQGDISGYDYGDVSYTEEGLVMTKSSQDLPGVWYWRLVNGWQPLVADQTMIRFRAKLEERSTLGFQTQVQGATGKIMMNINASSQQWLGSDNGSTMTNTYADGMGTNWMDYLVTSNGSTYSLYAKLTSATTWNLVGTSGGFWGTTANNVIEINSKGGAVVQSVEVLSPKDQFTMAEIYPELAKNQTMVVASEITMDKDFMTRYDVSGENPQKITISAGDGVSFSNENGLSMMGASSIQWKNSYDRWRAMEQRTKPVLVRAKVGDGQRLNFQGGYAYGVGGSTYIDVTPTSVYICGGVSTGNRVGTPGVTYKPGTGWVDYLIVSNHETNNYSMYARREGEEKWTHVATTTEYSKNNLNYFQVYGVGHVKAIQVLNPGERAEEGLTMHDIYPDLLAGQDMVPASGFEINGTFMKDLDVEGANAQKITIVQGKGTSFSDANGLYLGGEAAIRWAHGYDRWRAMEQRKKPVLIRAKVEAGQRLNFQAGYAYNIGGSTYIDIFPEGVYICGGVSTNNRVPTPDVTYKPGTGWVDYLIVSNNDVHNYSLYARRVGETKWVHVATTEEFSKNSLNYLQVYGQGYVKSIHVLNPATSESAIADQKAEIAAGMNLAKNEVVEYTEHPAYNPTIAKYSHIKAITYDGATYSDGRKTKVFAYVGFPEGASASSKVPAVVLIHGGGGHAYLEWVRLWNERGYAAIAMETTGYFPTAPNAGVDEGTENSANNYQYAFGDFAETGYALAPKCGNPTVYTPVKDQWNYHALIGIIKAGNILRQDERVDSSKMGVTGVSWGGTLTSQLIGIDNRFAFAIPIYGTAYLKLHPFENYNTKYVQELWAAEQNLDNANMAIMWYVWNDDGAFGIPGYMASYNHTAPLNDKTILFMRDSWGHSHGSVFSQGKTENHSKIFADWAINNRGGYPTFTEQPKGRTFNAKIDIPEDVTGEIKATLYYITEPMTYSTHNKFGYSTQNYLDQWWKKTTTGIKVDRATGTVLGTIPQDAAGYYINLEFTVNGVDCESTSVYVAAPQLKVTNVHADVNLSFQVECIQGGEVKSDLYAAIYNRQDVLIAVKKLDPVEKQTVTFTETGYDKIKVFWWDETQKPRVIPVET